MVSLIAQGIWITQIDIVKEAPALTLKQMATEKDEIGECQRECETISFACSEIVGEHDVEIVEYLWAHLGILSVSVPDFEGLWMIRTF